MTNPTHQNENLTVPVKVKDYATWRTGYDGREKSHLSAGHYHWESMLRSRHNEW